MNKPSVQAMMAFIAQRIKKEGQHELWTGGTSKGYPQGRMQWLHQQYAFQPRRVIWDQAHPEDPVRSDERIKHTCEHDMCIAAGCLVKQFTVEAVSGKRKHGNEHFHVISREKHLELVRASHVAYRAKAAIRKDPEKAYLEGRITLKERDRLVARNIEKTEARRIRYEAIRASGKWMGRGKGRPRVRRKKVESGNVGSGNDGHQTG